ncbi:MAG: type I restriction enzyme S subunit [Neptuniibacter pectenicola]
MSFPTVKFAEVCSVLSGFAFKSKQFGDKGLPIARIRDVVRGYSETFYDGEYKDDYILNNGDILIGMDGDFNIAKWKGGKALLNQRVCKVIPNQEKINIDYLFYYLPIALMEIWRVTPFVTVKHLSVKQINTIDVPLPPLPVQKQIAAVLEKADTLRSQCQQMEQELNSLAQSVFLDMFGDPVTNPKGLPIVNLKDLYVEGKEATKCGPFGSALKKNEFVDDGIPVWNMDNITKTGNFIDSPRLWITEKKFKDLQQYEIRAGDIIISRAGTVGKMCVVNSEFKNSIVSTNLIRLRLDPEKLLPQYFISLMVYCKGRVGRLKTGDDGAFSHMNTGILDKLFFPYPSIELQRDFLNKFNNIEALKVALNMHKQNLDNNFNSLMQRAFKGELELKDVA